MYFMPIPPGGAIVIFDEEFNWIDIIDINGESIPYAWRI